MEFLRGTHYLFEGFRVIQQPQLRRFILFPLLINIVLFSLLLFLAIYFFRDLIAWVQHFLPTWLQWLEWLMWIIAILALMIFWVYFSTILVNAVSGPFNTRLSEKITAEVVKTQRIPRSFLWELPLALKRQTQLILYYLPRALLYLLFFLIPILQIFAAGIWFSFNAWTMAMQYLDYPMDNHGVGIKQMKTLMQQKRSLNLGFGSAVIILTMIPFINFIVIPTAVAGATLLWMKEYAPLLEKVSKGMSSNS